MPWPSPRSRRERVVEPASWAARAAVADLSRRREGGTHEPEPASIEAAADRAARPAPPSPGRQKIEGRSPWQLAWARLRRDRAAMISFVVIVLIVLVAIFAPVFAAITGHGVNEQFRTDRPDRPTACPRARARRSCSAPTTRAATSWCGSPTAPGSRCSSAWWPPLLTVIIGAVVGLAAGYFGGVVDTILARARRRDAVLPVPAVRHLAWCRSSSPGLTDRRSSSSPSSGGRRSPGSSAARCCRSGRRSTSRRPARSGASPWRIMFVDILPNVHGPDHRLRHPAHPGCRSSPRRRCPSSASASHRPPRTGARCSAASQTVYQHGLVVPGLPGPRPVDHHAGLQHLRRRRPRRPRPARRPAIR